MLGNTRFISRVEHIMFNTRNKSGISAHPCTILHKFPPTGKVDRVGEEKHSQESNITIVVKIK
jgi:hypothetical protein